MLNNDVRMTLRVPGELRGEIEKRADADGMGFSDWCRASLEVMSRATLGRLPRHLQREIEKVAQLADLAPEDWIRNALELAAASDLQAYRRLEVSRHKVGAVQIAERCVHANQYVVQGVFAKYCTFCGTENPL